MRKPFSSLVATCAAMALLLVSPCLLQANLITNGDFEANVGLTPPAWGLFFPSISGWTAVKDQIEIQTNFTLGGQGGTPNGIQYEELDANNPGEIRSDYFATVNGQKYDVSFLYSARPGGFSTQAIQVSTFDYINSFGNLNGFSRVATGSVNFSLSGFSFIGTGNLMSLDFLSLSSSGSVGNLIDDVSVTAAVPEPSSFALLGLGGIGLAIGAYRRRRAVAI